jgi:hypothetical protein
MTLCVKTGAHCVCQPDEGAFCPDYKPDAYVQCLMDAITELLRRPDVSEPVAYRWKWDKHLEWHYGEYLSQRDYYASEPLYRSNAAPSDEGSNK